MPNYGAEFTQMLTDIVVTSESFPVFLVADGNLALCVRAKPEVLGGNPDGAKIIFQQAREFALQHPQLQKKHLMVFQIAVMATPEGERVLVSSLDEQKDLMAIPYRVVRNAKGQIVQLVDTGDVAQLAGTFLSAFLIGIETSNQPEKQARVKLDREMSRLGNDLMRLFKERRKP